MSDKLPSRESRAQAKAEAKARRAAEVNRRRWITLGEVVAVIALGISALTLWNSWSERSDSVAVKNADAQQASARAAALVLVVASSSDGKLILKPASTEQSVQSQIISFPTPLGVTAVDTTGESRIDAAWFEHALKNARGLSHLPDNSRGDERLPVVITTSFLAGSEPHDDIALYDIGYSISGHWLGGHSVALRGVSLVARLKSSSAQARLDARWNRFFPKR